MAPPCPVLAGYRLVAPGPYACFPFKFVQESACCSCVCCNLETLRLRFLVFRAGFSFGLSLQSEAGLRMMMGFIFLWPTFVFSLLPAVLACNSCRNNSILLDPFFWAGHFISFLSGLSQALFCFFLLMGSYVPLFSFSFWASTARLLILLGFLDLFANSTLPWALLLTSLGFPGLITLSLSLGFMSLP